jgi:tetratricopeptide (TPR) repeat protein
MLSVAVVLFGATVITSAQTLQEVVEARNKGSELMAAKDLDGAIAELEKCVDLAKKVGGDDAEEHQIVAESVLPNLYLTKANNISATRDYPATIKALEVAASAAEKYNNADVKGKAEKAIAPIYLAMGQADFQAQKFNEAIQNLDQVIARDPNNVNAYFIKGACFQQLKDEAKMDESYKLAIEKGTANNDATTVQRAKTQLINYYNNAGATAQRTQKWDDAIAAFSKTVEVDDKNDAAYYSLSSCYNSKKSWDNAISNGQKALELRSGGDAKALDGIYYQLGTAYAGKSDTGKACEYFKKVANDPFLAGAKYQVETALKCK